MIRSLAQRGVWGTLVHAWNLGATGLWQRFTRRYRELRVTRINRLYDRRHRCDTWRSMPQSEFDAQEEALDYAIWYAPIPARSFSRLLHALPVDYERFDFIDYGAGKGKALLLASEFPFARVTGVEFASNLADTARRNIASARLPVRRCREIDMVCADARDFAIPDRPCVFYFYSPFTGELLATVLETIRLSLSEAPRPALILFVDDDVPNNLAIPVADYLGNWSGWKPLELPRLPADPGALYPLVVTAWGSGL